MFGEPAANLAVHGRFVGHKASFAVDIAEHDRVNVSGAAILNVEPLALATVAVNQRQNRQLVAGALLDAATSLEADVGFVNLNRAAVRTERGSEIAGTHRFADTVRHKPRGLEGDTENAVKLVARKALLAPGDQIHRLKPDVHRNLAVLKDGADLDGERLAALIALPQARAGGLALELADALHAAAMRADGAIRPQPRLNVSVGRFFVVKVRGGKVRHGRLRFVGTYLRRTSGYVKYNNAKLMAHMPCMKAME